MKSQRYIVAFLLMTILLASCVSDRTPPTPTPTASFFTNIAGDVGLAGNPVHRVLWTDINGDHWPDAVLFNLGSKAERQLQIFINTAHGFHTQQRVLKDMTKESGINQHPTPARLSVGTGGQPDQVRMADALIFGDIDNDGDVDAFSSKWCDLETPKQDPQTKEPMRDAAGKIVMANEDDGLRSEILLNDGQGHFSIRNNSGVGARAETTGPTVFLDYDNDGILDLFTGNWYRQYGWSMECYPSRLYKGRGDGTFTEVTESAGLMTIAEPGQRNSSRPVYGTSHCDWNNDGFQDILVSVYGRQWNFLWKNLGNGAFSDVAAETGFDGDENRSGIYPPQVKRPTEPPYRANGNTFDAACADFDNDGDIDVFLAEITHWWAGSSSDLSALLINQGAEQGFRFIRDPDNRGIVRQHPAPDWNQGDLMAGWLDFDNDGLLDLLIASSDYPDGQYLRLYQQQPDHTFIDVTLAAGFNWECAPSISLADFDHDGDVDILAGKSFTRFSEEMTKGKIREVALFRNDIGNKNNWINITLVGKGKEGANRSAIGSRVVVKCGNIQQTREVYGGLGHFSHQDSLDLKFGLGKNTRIDSIEVHWANKEHTTQIFKDVKPNAFIMITEGSDKIEMLPK